jgi:hypothetical protein
MSNVYQKLKVKAWNNLATHKKKLEFKKGKIKLDIDLKVEMTNICSESRKLKNEISKATVSSFKFVNELLSNPKSSIYLIIFHST